MRRALTTWACLLVGLFVCSPLSLARPPKDKPGKGSKDDDDRKPSKKDDNRPNPKKDDDKQPNGRFMPIRPQFPMPDRNDRGQKDPPAVNSRVPFPGKVPEKGPGRVEKDGEGRVGAPAVTDRMRLREERQAELRREFNVPPQRQPLVKELDLRIQARLPRVAGPKPPSFTQQQFVRRQLDKDTVTDIYQVVTYQFERQGTGWVPVVADQRLVKRIEPRKDERPLRWDGLQDQVFEGAPLWNDGADDVLPFPQPGGIQLLPAPPAAVLREYKTKFVVLENATNRMVDVYYHYVTLDRLGIPNQWLPVRPEVNRPLSIRLLPGEVAALFNNEFRVDANRLRIWAQEPNGPRRWNEFQQKDYWIVPPEAPVYRAPQRHTERVVVRFP